MRDSTPTALDASSLRIGIACSRYHAQVTDRLCEGARQVYRSAGGAADRLEVVAVPGAWELVAACRSMVDDGFDALVALGCILTGETIHDQVIANAVSNGLINLTVQSGTPITLGVLTCRTLDQAIERAGGLNGNKGAEAMSAAIELTMTIRSRAGRECIR